MIPVPFEYFSPKSLSEAIALLKKHGSEAKILACGQSLIPLMKLLHHLSIINMDSAWSPCRLRTASFTFPR